MSAAILAIAAFTGHFLTFAFAAAEARVASVDHVAAQVQVDEPSVVIVEETVGGNNGVGSVGALFGYSLPSGGFMHGFVATFCVIIVSELGDKTFFIAAIMAMRHSRLTVVSGAISALAIMHVMSAIFGSLVLKIVPKTYTFYLSSALFAIFGLKMLKEARSMSPDDGQEEMEEVREELLKKESEEEAVKAVPGDLESGQGFTKSLSRLKRLLVLIFSPIFVQAFTMTFVAEWGDRSQLATIVLAAREDLSAIIIAGIIGHSICTGLAVLGGRLIAQRISVKTVTYVGGFVFLVFAMTALFMDPEAT